MEILDQLVQQVQQVHRVLQAQPGQQDGLVHEEVLVLLVHRVLQAQQVRGGQLGLRDGQDQRVHLQTGLYIRQLTTLLHLDYKAYLGSTILVRPV